MRPAISIFAIIIFSTIITSCSKDEEKLSFPLQTRFISLENQEAIRVFTKSGEITDPAVVKRFTSGSEYFGTSYSPLDKSGIITFQTDSTALLGASSQFYRASKTDGRITLSSDFAITDASSNYPIGGFLDLYRLWKNAEPVEKTPLGLGQTLYKGKYLIVLYGDYSSFKLPALSFKIKRTMSTSTVPPAVNIQSGVAFNEFNAEYLNTLRENDTVAVQQSWLRFKK